MNGLPRSALGAALVLIAAPLAAATPPIHLGDLELRFAGRVQYDHLFDSDAPQARQPADDGDFRRARLGLRARWFQDWVFVASGDFVDSPRLRDLSLEYRALPVRIEIGRFQEPFGLAEHGSSRDTLFMERPGPSALGPDYGLGAALNYRGERWGLTAGAFAADDSPHFGGDRNEQALSARLTVNPLRGDALLHLGAGYSARRSEESAGLRVSGSAETFLVRGYAPRSPRDAQEDEYRLAGAEAALRLGSALLQAEYIDVASDGAVEGGGWYAELGWILTGEKRAYSTRWGNFDGVDPQRPLFGGGIGALEVGLRYSSTDLSDNGGERGEVAGIALNWYPIEYLRLSVNALRVRLEPPGAAAEEADAIQGRVQLHF